jgi:HlyD family secretion protein
MANTSGVAWMKWTMMVLLAGAAGFGVWFYLTRRPAPPEYQTAAVTRGDLTQVVTASGQLDPVLNIQVGSQISGRIQKLYVDYNSVVKSNQVIAEIEPATYQVALHRAEADLANAKANLALAEVQAHRADSLYTNHLISASDHDIAQAQMQQAQAQVQASEAAVENARVDLSRCTIYAPVDGVVITRSVDVGQTVAASFNTPTLFLIANDLTKMQIDALVSEADIGGVAVGQDVDFTVDAYPYRTFKGKLSQVRYGSITNQNVVNYDCVIDVNNGDLKLLPGMTANVSIITAERNNALKIPNAALRFRPPEAGVSDIRTNTGFTQVSQANRANADAGARGGGGRSPGSGGGGAGMGEAPGGARRSEGGDRAGPGSAGRPRPERQVVRTVYVLPAKTKDAIQEAAKPKPAQIKVGITDGKETEVLDGLQENDQIVTGLILSADGSRTGTPAANPFGGGFRRF